MNKPTYSLSDLSGRIATKIQISDEGCWLWQGYIRPNGYGQAHWERWPHLVHRLVYALLVRPLSDTEVLDHLCGKKACVNPAHLEPVTLAENIRRAGRANRKETCSKGHPIITAASGRRRCRECAQGRQRTSEYRASQREYQRIYQRQWKKLQKRRPGMGQAPLF
jgi:hypothetical protein